MWTLQCFGCPILFELDCGVFELSVWTPYMFRICLRTCINCWYLLHRWFALCTHRKYNMKPNALCSLCLNFVSEDFDNSNGEAGKLSSWQILAIWILTNCYVLGQLRPFFWVNCAHFVKSWKLSTVILIYMNYNFLICHILCHFQDGRHWPWKFHMGQKLKHALISLKIVSNCLSCRKDSKNV